jgi:hypothetical protein
MTAGRTLALVESPAQLLNAIEWGHATGGLTGLRIVVLAPLDPRGVAQLSAVAELAGGLGLDIRVEPVRAGARSRMAGAAHLARELPAVEQLVLGDPFSGFMQALLPLVAARRLVVIDDGTATWEFASCIDQQRPMVRWGQAEARSRRGSFATRALSPRFGRELTVFTSLTDAVPLGASGLPNDYAWACSLGTPSVAVGETAIIGTSLVATGLVDRAAYVAAVAAVAGRHSAGSYVAHRREDDRTLSEIASASQLRIERPNLPVELAARVAPTIAEHLITFPSTTANTLPIVLAGLGVRVEMCPPEEAWFTAAATPHARRFVQRIADGSRATHLLDVA